MSVKQKSEALRNQQRRGQVRSFRAATMDEAHELIHRELGMDAIVVSAKQLVRKGRFPWSQTAGDFIVTARSAVAPTEHMNRRQQLSHDPRNIRVNRAPLSVVMKEGGPAEAAIQPNGDELPPTVQSASESNSQVPGLLAECAAQLNSVDVDSSIAANLMAGLERDADQAQLHNRDAVSNLLTAILESGIATANPIRVTAGQRQVVAVVGPAGVGKTTTLSKLAARFAISESTRMAIITFDTYRIAAVEQLRTYAGIIDLPVHVVTNPIEMRRAIEETRDFDLVLIDTGGHSPNDELRMQQLKKLLIAAEVDDILLCLSATSGRSSLALYGKQFAAIGATSLIITKTDEAVGPGSILNVLEAASLPVSYLSCGQNVPDDLEPANATRIARLITDQESI